MIYARRYLINKILEFGVKEEKIKDMGLEELVLYLETLEKIR